MTTAKVFKSGNSQAVRLPKEFRFASDEVESSAGAMKSSCAKSRGTCCGAISLVDFRTTPFDLADRGQTASGA